MTFTLNHEVKGVFTRIQIDTDSITTTNKEQALQYAKTGFRHVNNEPKVSSICFIIDNYAIYYDTMSDKDNDIITLRTNNPNNLFSYDTEKMSIRKAKTLIKEYIEATL